MSYLYEQERIIIVQINTSIADRQSYIEHDKFRVPTNVRNEKCIFNNVFFLLFHIRV